MGSLLTIFSECLGYDSYEPGSRNSNDRIPLLVQNNLDNIRNSVETSNQTSTNNHNELKERVSELEQNFKILGNETKKKEFNVDSRIGYLEKRMDALGNALNGSVMQDIDLQSEF